MEKQIDNQTLLQFGSDLVEYEIETPYNESLDRQGQLSGSGVNRSSRCKRKNQETGKNQYKGVRMRSWGSWVSEIRAPNQKTRIWLGSYSTSEAAARAYDAALVCLKGRAASTNFADSADLLDNLTIDSGTMSPRSIQRIAAAAANNSKGNFSSPRPTNMPIPTSKAVSTVEHNVSEGSSRQMSASSQSLLQKNQIKEESSVTTAVDEYSASTLSSAWIDHDSVQILSPRVSTFDMIQCSNWVEDYNDHDQEVLRLWSFN